MSFDIHFQLFNQGEGSGQGKLFSFGFISAIGVKGPQKLVNRWIKCLFTPKGTDAFVKTYGTGFGDLVGSNIGGIQDVQDAASLFIDDCSDQIRAQDRLNGLPDDERLKSATITNIVPRAEDGFDITVELRNVAGASLTFLLPTLG